MLTLGGKVIEIRNNDLRSERGDIFRLTKSKEPGNAKSAFLVSDREIPIGHGAYFVDEDEKELLSGLVPGQVGILLPRTFRYLDEGDVFRVEGENSRIRVLYRKKSLHNHFLVTERCDNYCLMCSQPPRNVDDDWVIDEILQIIPLIDPDCREIGFTGGEPTLLGQRLIEVLETCKAQLPNTAIHVLSNGRHFSDERFTTAWARVNHPDLMVGIPIYSDVSTIHDYVVQADGAYDQTIRGILNLKRLNQRVEVRVVLHKQTYRRLPQLAEFLSRNLLFVDHVALMGLEITGFTRANLDALWIDPTEYQKELYEAVQILAANGMRVSIYNLPLCLVDRRLWSWAVQSISDWKNEYLPACDECDVKNRCAGFFSSAKFKCSDNISPIKNEVTVA